MPTTENVRIHELVRLPFYLIDCLNRDNAAIMMTTLCTFVTVRNGKKLLSKGSAALRPA